MDDGARHARFQAIYEANYARILGYALRRVAEPEDATDVVAETFVVAWRRLDDVPRGEEARLWLYGVARRTLANQRRAERRRSQLGERLRQELPALAELQPAPSDPGRLREAFGRLRASDRELLGLVAWEGLTPPELAAVLGCSQNAARIRLHRARRRLARELERVGVDLKRGHPAGHELAEAGAAHPPATPTALEKAR